MPQLIPVLSREEIALKVEEVARQISCDYRNRELVLIAVLKGAFVFFADLVRRLEVPVKLDFIRVASYGSQTCSSGNIRLTKPVEIDIRDRDVLVVEDIVDSGLTLTFVLDYLQAMAPRSLKVCALIDKHERRQKGIRVDYACHRVEQGFLVGYGLDYDENYRALPALFHLNI